MKKYITVSEGAAAVGQTRRKDKCRHNEPDAQKIEYCRLFVARVRRPLTRLKHVGLEPKGQLVSSRVMLRFIPKTIFMD